MKNIFNHKAKWRKPKNGRNAIFSIVCTLFSIFQITPSFSQNFFSNLFKGDGSRHKSLYEQHSDISLGIGTSNYYGDLAPFNRPVQSTLQNIRWNASFNYTRHFSPHLSGRVGFTWARIAADDNRLEGVAGLEQLYVRNLHFRNDIKELSFSGIYNFVPESRSFRNREKIIPYIFAGIAIFHHNPEAKVPKDYAGSEASPGEWVSLQPLSTEGQGLISGNPAANSYEAQPYNLINVSIPMGIGLRYKLNREWDLGFEVGLRYVFTDYLDDLGGVFADKGDIQTQVGNLAAAMSHRENEKISALSGKDREALVRAFYVKNGYSALADANLFPMSTFPEIDDIIGIRNSSSRFDDMYLLTTFKIIYHITPSIKCPVIR